MFHKDREALYEIAKRNNEMFPTSSDDIFLPPKSVLRTLHLLISRNISKLKPIFSPIIDLSNILLDLERSLAIRNRSDTFRLSQLSLHENSRTGIINLLAHIITADGGPRTSQDESNPERQFVRYTKIRTLLQATDCLASLVGSIHFSSTLSHQTVKLFWEDPSTPEQSASNSTSDRRWREAADALEAEDISQVLQTVLIVPQIVHVGPVPAVVADPYTVYIPSGTNSLISIDTDSHIVLLGPPITFVCFIFLLYYGTITSIDFFF